MKTPPGREPAPREPLWRNALSGGGRHVVSALLALLVTPYALSVLGDTRFGLWALGGALLGALRVLDLGVDRSLMRAVAGARGRGAPDAARPAMASARGLLLLVGLSALVLIAALHRPLSLRVFAVPPALLGEAAVVFVGTAAVAALEHAFSPFRAGLDGLGRMDLGHGVDGLQRIASALGTAAVLWAGFGLAGLVAKNLALALLAGLAYRRLLRLRAPGLARTRPALVPHDARALLAFGGQVQVVALGALAFDLGAKLILGRAEGLGSVAIYELAARVTTQLGAALLAASMAVFPAAAALHEARVRESEGAEGDGPRDAAQVVPDRLAARDARLVALHRRAARALSWLVLPGYGLLAALALPFAAAWLGPGYEAVGLALLPLSLGWALAILSAPAALVAQAGGRPALATRASLVTPTVGLGLALALRPALGTAGVVLGISAGLAAGGLAMWALFARGYGLGARVLDFLDARAILALLLGALAARAAMAALPVTLGGVGLAAGLGLGAYAALGWAAGIRREGRSET